MSTIESVKTQIQTLIEQANTTTGVTSTDLTSAINILREGYGQGGSSGGISSGVEYLELDASRKNITSVKVYSGHNRIFIRQFSNQSYLKNVEMPDSITSIEQYAFYECEDLALTSLPSSLTTIGIYAFYGCTNLALTSLPSGVTKISSNTFYGCTNLALTSLPSSLKEIGKSAFQNCINLPLTSLPSSLKEIGKSAFEYCDKLALTSLPSGVTSVSESAFSGCSGLTNIELPSVTSIARYAFQNCENLATLILRSSSVCQLSNSNALTGTPIASGTGFIYVPDNLVDSYKSATNWSTYASQIKPISKLGE